jgi:hypothetical protein
MKHLPIIGLAGRMESGKDAAANYLRRHSFSRAAFADEVRREVAHALLINTLPNTAATAEIRGTFAACNVRMVYAKPTADPMRKLLQWWGTEYRRAADPRYWISKLERKLDYSQDWVISDVRYANEAEWVRQNGGEVWRIDRSLPVGPGIHTSLDRAEQGFRGHASERLMFPVDRVISNLGGLQDLAEALSDAYYKAKAA